MKLARTCKECGWPIPTEVDVVHECDLDEVRARERSRIVAWLRKWADDLGPGAAATVARSAAELIELGEVERNV